MTQRALLCGLIAVGLVACTPPSATYQATMYYADRDLRVLVPVTRPVTADRAGLPAAVVAGMLEAPDGLTSVLPTGSTINEVARQDDVVTVDVAPPQAGLQGAAMVQEALALSLVGLDGIEQVRLIGLPKGEAGLDFSQPTGRPRHPNRWLDAGEAEGTWITVAWQLKEQPYLVPVSVPAGSDAAADRLAVWQQGPTGSRQQLLRGLWPANQPLGVVGQNGQTLTVRFPQQLPQVDWGPALRALSWTLTETAGVEHVQVTGETLPPGLESGARLDRPPALNPSPHS